MFSSPESIESPNSVDTFAVGRDDDLHNAPSYQSRLRYYNDNRYNPIPSSSEDRTPNNDGSNSIYYPTHDSIKIHKSSTAQQLSSFFKKCSIPKPILTKKTKFELENCDEDDIFGSHTSLDQACFSHVKVNKKRHGPGRVNWKNKIQFFLAFVGYSMGLPNVWRFPYLCYDNYGGAFFIPYIIMMFICAFPLLYLELAIGQMAQAGPIIAIWKFSPLFKGLGIASVFLAFVVGLYNIVIVTWSLFYVFKSFGNTLPWSTCNNKWNTNHCYSMNASYPENKYHTTNMTIPSTQEFFENRVLVATHDYGKYKYIQWELAILLFIAWVIVFFGIRKGVKSIGQAFYLTSTIPLLTVLIMLIKSVMLPGAYKGLNYLVKPIWSKLLIPEIWILAATQSFYSLGIAFGSVIALASYNEENNNIFRDSVMMTFTSTFISIIVMVTTFSVIGHIAHINNHDIEEAITQGPGLIFVVYPQVFSTLPYTQIWAFLYFLMIICLGLDRQFATVEVVVTSFYDVKLLDKYLPGRQFLVLIVCLVSYILGLFFLAHKGIQYLHLVDYFVVGISFLHVAFFEVLMVIIFFGVKKLSCLLRIFTHKQPPLYIILCWYAAPVFLMTLMSFHLAQYTTIRYDDMYNYPKLALGLGWFISYMPIICVLVGFCIKIYPNKNLTMGQRFVESFNSVMSLETYSFLGAVDPSKIAEMNPTLLKCYWHFCNRQHSKQDSRNVNYNRLPSMNSNETQTMTHVSDSKQLTTSSNLSSPSYRGIHLHYHNKLAHHNKHHHHHRYHKNKHSGHHRKMSLGNTILADSNTPGYCDPEEFVLQFMPEMRKLIAAEKLLKQKHQRPQASDHDQKQSKLLNRHNLALPLHHHNLHTSMAIKRIGQKHQVLHPQRSPKTYIMNGKHEKNLTMNKNRNKLITSTKRLTHSDDTLLRSLDGNREETSPTVLTHPNQYYTNSNAMFMRNYPLKSHARNKIVPIYPGLMYKNILTKDNIHHTFVKL